MLNYSMFFFVVKLHLINYAYFGMNATSAGMNATGI